ncbi:MAG: coproporphyrinogen III oxidase, partial [Hymenobacteraceae bacterium]|nr:coproporphyrinogen III oxidase [Hymenobacteraceae bacterium]
IQLQPDRIAFYSYAHVPWKHKAQRGYSEADLPSDSAKYALYEAGKKLLLQNGYEDVGMDHFAKPTDELHLAKLSGTLHRNFMGYTTTPSKLLIGLGVSSISDAYSAYAQNVKTVEEYYKLLEQNELPLLKGYTLTDADTVIRQHILNMACRNTTALTKHKISESQYDDIMRNLFALESDGLLIVTAGAVQVTDIGNRFIRNICAAFVLNMLAHGSQPMQMMFSKAV